MCFTVSVDLPGEELEKRYDVSFPDKLAFKPGYFFSAFTHPALPVITSENPGQVSFARWGLIPGWVRSGEEAGKIRDKTINARMETLFRKPSFRGAAGGQHCLVPVSGFYEWHEHQGKKYPFFLHLKKGKSFALAGLFDKWLDPGSGELIHTFALITAPASPLLSRIHNTRRRMPVVLEREKEKDWLKTQANPENLLSLLSIPGDEVFDYYPVYIKNAVKNPQDPSVIRPHDYGFDLTENTLF